MGGSGIEAYIAHSRGLREQFCTIPRYFNMWRRAVRARGSFVRDGEWPLRKNFKKCEMLSYHARKFSDIEPMPDGTFLNLIGGSAASDGTNSGDDFGASDEEISEDGTEQSDPDYVPNPADGDPSEKETSNTPAHEHSKVRMGTWETMIKEGRQLLQSGKLDTLIKTILDYAQQRNVNETKNYGYQQDRSDTAEQVLADTVADIPDDKDFYGVYCCLKK